VLWLTGRAAELFPESIDLILPGTCKKKESLFRLSFVCDSGEAQKPGMNEYPIETAKRDAFTLLNSKLL
jgi:hypothetical protein